MSRGTTLSNLRLMLRAEIGQTMNTSAATANDSTLNKLLANEELWLASAYDWPFLEDRWDVSVAATTRYVNMPTLNIRAVSSQINTERPFTTEVFFNNAYQDVSYGIGSQEYNHRNSDKGETLDPIQRWKFDTNVDEASNPDQFEVWPMPVTTQVMRFTGQRQLLPLVSDSDKADLDDLLLVYTVAAELAQRLEQADAPIKQAKAGERMRQLRGVYPNRDEKLILGRNLTFQPGMRRIVPLIIVK